jgi:hypothetical protein
LGGSGDH